MLPLMLDLRRLPVALIGGGEAACRRLALLEAAGAEDLTVYAPVPIPALARAAGARLCRRLPATRELAAARLVFIGDKVTPESAALAATARALGALVHVEDAPALSDAHAPAVVRRGDLVIAVSTGGRSPGLARKVKRFLGRLFGPEWQGRLDALAAMRQAWRAAGAGPEAVSRWTEDWVDRQGWLAAEIAPAAASPQSPASLQPGIETTH
jgi:precorrin-2 dehydrogenase/sirohydrochlorin ferrochelatase